jgi:hypothetical protein
MTDVQETTARERLESGDRLLSLSEIATVLHQKKSNVAKFLARRNVDPAMKKAAGYWWWQSDILRVKAERDANTAQMASNERRRQSAVKGEQQNGGLPAKYWRLGAAQRKQLVELLVHPVSPKIESHRLALRRLEPWGLVESEQDVDRVTWYSLTDEGRRVAALLA